MCVVKSTESLSAASGFPPSAYFSGRANSRSLDLMDGHIALVADFAMKRIIIVKIFKILEHKVRKYPTVTQLRLISATIYL